MALTEWDYEEIRQLFARYSQTLDLGDADGFAACFAADGALDTSGLTQGPGGVWRGQEALRALVADLRERTAGRVRQSALNPLIDGDGTTASATSYAVVTQAYVDGARGETGDTASSLATTGIFFDEFVKVDGHWLFALRMFRHDGLPEVLDLVRTPGRVGPDLERIA